MAVDSQPPTSDSLGDSQIIEMVTSSSQSSHAGSEDEEEEEEHISSSTVDTLMRYFGQGQLIVGLQHSVRA